ncbi:MAG: hypothetical protein KBD78_16135, partial [Oligoflexales bacterium]|nr:hypothetical protein [Oligoflexales bacterium]
MQKILVIQFCLFLMTWSCVRSEKQLENSPYTVSQDGIDERRPKKRPPQTIYGVHDRGAEHLLN